jgi:hypothetical protein
MSALVGLAGFLSACLLLYLAFALLFPETLA